eukprot:6592873-Alexandrium_andersonii.AAC.1
MASLLQQCPRAAARLRPRAQPPGPEQPPGQPQPLAALSHSSARHQRGAACLGGAARSPLAGDQRARPTQLP